MRKRATGDGPPPYLSDLARLVFQRRKQLRGADRTRYDYPLPLRDAAAQIGVSPATLSRVENGKAPDIESFRRICLWLGRSADELLGINVRAE